MKYHCQQRDQLLYLAFPYDADLVDEIKGRLPGGTRWWDAEERCWVIERGYWREAVALLEEWGDACTECPPCRAFALPVRPANKQAPGGLDTLYLEPGAPPEIVKAAYRALALLYHPDRGGSNKEMRQINLAYERLSGAR